MKRYFNPLVLVGLIIIIGRYWINFSNELIPGINGGYYPLQVRSLIENHQLAFSDMPLLFYLNFCIIKIINVFGLVTTDQLIISVIKWVDCFSLLLLYLPLHKLAKYFIPDLSSRNEIILVLFTFLTISPQILIGDLQKNTLAIPLAITSLYFLIQIFRQPSKFNLILYFLFAFLTALTHFGVFFWLLLFSLLFLIFMSGWKSFLIVSITIIGGLSIVALFDQVRFFRLLNISSELFRHPIMFSDQFGPPEIINLAISIFFVSLALKHYFKNRNQIDRTLKAIVLTSSVMLFLVSIPLIDIEYYKRLNLMSFLLQSLLIIYLMKYYSVKALFLINCVIIFFVTFSVMGFFFQRKVPVITDEEYHELAGFKKIISKNDSEIVVARHGLEWWTAFALRTKVAQEKAIDINSREYSRYYFLVHRRNLSMKMPNNQFDEPKVPKNAELIYQSSGFQLFQFER
jgi:hypothetical protein